MVRAGKLDVRWISMRVVAAAILRSKPFITQVFVSAFDVVAPFRFNGAASSR
jgi:hypothetical protein